MPPPVSNDFVAAADDKNRNGSVRTLGVMPPRLISLVHPSHGAVAPPTSLHLGIFEDSNVPKCNLPRKELDPASTGRVARFGPFVQRRDYITAVTSREAVSPNRPENHEEPRRSLSITFPIFVSPNKYRTISLCERTAQSMLTRWRANRPSGGNRLTSTLPPSQRSPPRLRLLSVRKTGAHFQACGTIGESDPRPFNNT